MKDNETTKLGYFRAKLLSFSSNEKAVCAIFNVAAIAVVALSLWYSYTQLKTIEYTVYTFAIAAQCAGALVLVLEVFGESEEKQLCRALGTPILWGELSGNLVPVGKIRSKVSEIASKRASAVILLIGFAIAFVVSAPDPSTEALCAFASLIVGIIMTVQSYAIWKMIKFKGDNINLKEFYSKKIE